jgi:hypothetical protein
MAKKAKRREWTKDDVRELKTLARQKTPVAKIAKSPTPMCVARRKKIWCSPSIGFICISTLLDHSFCPCKQLKTLNNVKIIITSVRNSGRAHFHANGRM